MKRLMRVTEIKEFEIEIPDENITGQFLDDFENTIGYNNDTPNLLDKINEIFNSVAYQIRSGDYVSLFVEGVGMMTEPIAKTRFEDVVGTYRVMYEDTEIEVVE